MLNAKGLCSVKDNTAPEARPLVSSVEELTAVKKNVLELGNPFNNMQNIVIESVGDNHPIPETVIRLAVRMMNSNRMIRDILVTLRQLYIHREKSFSFSLKEKEEMEKNQIIALFQDMEGIFSSVHYCPEFQTLKGELVFTPKAQKFLTGQYLELAVYEVVRELLQELAEKYQMTYEIHRNVCVTTCEGRQKNEFDIVFCFDQIFYVIECKSGKNFNDFSSICEIGQKYGILDRFLLVDSYISDYKAEIIEYFCDYYVCSLNNNSLRKKITQMITNDIEKV